MKYGSFWFMDNTICVNEKMFQDNLTRIQQEVKRSKEDFIQEHFSKYKSPSLPHKLKGSWIDVSHTEQVKFYAQLCYLAYLQDCIHPNNTFKKELLDLLKAHPNVDTKAMGFPEDWQSEPLWN